MLRLVESRDEKVDAQRKLTTSLETAWQNREMRHVVWRPDSRDMTVVPITVDIGSPRSTRARASRFRNTGLPSAGMRTTGGCR